MLHWAKQNEKSESIRPQRVADPKKKTQHKMSGAKRGEHSPANLAEELKKKKQEKTGTFRGLSGEKAHRRLW